MAQQPVGERVNDTSTRPLPAHKGFKGQYVELHQVDPQTQLDDLYAASSGSAEKESVWTYMPLSGPFANPPAMATWLGWCRDHSDYIFYAVYDKTAQRYVGMTSFCSIVPQMQRIEVGFIWYSPEVQRTKINTESIYLMLCEAFDRLQYRRVEWKCDSLNQPSRNAALRLGFSYEGLFRKHMIVKGLNRDTAWFAMLDMDWPTIKDNLQDWLYHSQAYFSLTARQAAKPRLAQHPTELE